MGFTTGFLGGLTLTYSLLYFSIYIHRSNRTFQATLLSQQAKLLDSKLSPPEPEYELPAYRVEKAGLSEQLKDRWNREVENVLRNVQETDWEEVRIRWEKRIGHVWNSARSSDKGQELEQRMKDTVVGTEEALKHGAQNLKQVASAGAQNLKETANTTGQRLKESVIGTEEALKQGAQSAKAVANTTGQKRLLEV